MAEFVLIIGVTGYIGFKTLLTALEAGHSVRAIVRKIDQVERLRSHPKISPLSSQLEIVIVPDMAIPGAFDAPMLDVTAVINLASPLAIETDDYERDIIAPAMTITASVLSSASKVSSVKRVIITSSQVTLVPFQWNFEPDTLRLYTSGDINTNPTTPYSSAMEAYWASKALARLEVRKFMQEHKPRFHTVQLLPSVVIGKDDRQTSEWTVDDILEGTRKMVLGPLLGIKSEFPLVGTPVDVADVARAHVDAVTMRMSGDREFVLTAETPEGVIWDDVVEIARKHFGPECGHGATLPLGGSLGTVKLRVDNSDMEEAFGWKCKGLEETIVPLIQQYVDIAKKR